MTQYGFPFDNTSITENDFSEMFSQLQDTGVVPDATAELTVSADGSGMTVTLGPGKAYIRGHFYTNDADVTLTIPASASLPRIDTVAIQLDPASNTIQAVVVSGAAASSPSAPALTQTETGVYEMAVANVAVAADAVVINSGNVTDVRRRTGQRIGDWVTAARPDSPILNQVGWNRSLSYFERWNGSSWVALLRWTDIQGRPTKSTIDGRTIFVSDAAPTAGDGVDGDIWLEY